MAEYPERFRRTSDALLNARQHATELAEAAEKLREVRECLVEELTRVTQTGALPKKATNDISKALDRLCELHRMHNAASYGSFAEITVKKAVQQAWEALP